MISSSSSSGGGGGGRDGATLHWEEDEEYIFPPIGAFSSYSSFSIGAKSSEAQGSAVRGLSLSLRDETKRDDAKRSKSHPLPLTPAFGYRSSALQLMGCGLLFSLHPFPPSLHPFPSSLSFLVLLHHHQPRTVSIYITNNNNSIEGSFFLSTPTSPCWCCWCCCLSFSFNNC